MGRALHDAVAAPRRTIWTIGHSSHPIAEFVGLLRANAIECVADVRRHAGSRKHPQFGPQALESTLGAAGIAYLPLPALGGRRMPRADSPHGVWRNDSFRGYADYMDTPEFGAALAALEARAAATRTALMCAEALWWRCHRALIADALKASGWRVLHIMGNAAPVEHPYTSAASIVGGRLEYGAAASAGD